MLQGIRKVLFGIVTMAIIVVLFVTSKLSESAFKDILIWLIGFFFGGNAVEHAPAMTSAIGNMVKNMRKSPAQAEAEGK